LETWKGYIAGIFVVVVSVMILYPLYSPVVPAPDLGLSTSSTQSAESTVSSSQTTSANTTASAPPTITQTATSQAQFDSAWISQFISVVNVARGGSTLAPCAHLETFAMIRFKTLNTGNNWEVVHYGYTEDLQRAYGGTAGSYAEEYFYPVTPSYRSPSGFASFVQTTAPGHWSDLVNPLYRFYGVYSGTGPVLLFPHNCASGEFGPGVNQTQVASGCSYQKVTGTWFMVELSDACVAPNP
jgi:hypothetical protein